VKVHFTAKSEVNNGMFTRSSVVPDHRECNIAYYRSYYLVGVPFAMRLTHDRTLFLMFLKVYPSHC